MALVLVVPPLGERATLVLSSLSGRMRLGGAAANASAAEEPLSWAKASSTCPAITPSIYAWADRRSQTAEGGP